MDEISLEEKCENLMNVVVESRKRFGKMCVDYEHKTSLMENKLLNLQLETISSYRFKPKQAPLKIEVDDMRHDTEDFAIEIMERRQRLEQLKSNIRNTQQVVLQLKNDKIGRKLREPLNVDVLLSNVRSELEL